MIIKKMYRKLGEVEGGRKTRQWQKAEWLRNKKEVKVTQGGEGGKGWRREGGK